MRTNRKVARVFLATALVALISAAVPLPAAAGTGGVRSAAAVAPPLPEWPVIGPVLQWLGLASNTDVPTPTPGLPEYRISSLDDLDNLDGIGRGERIRIIAAEGDLNAMIREAIEATVGSDARATVGVEPNILNVRIVADESLLERYADNMPRQIRGNLDLDGTFRFHTSQCVPRLTIQRLQLNGWSFGLRLLAQGPLNTRLREVWPDEICVERVIVMQDDIAVEGYHR